ncbi:MAG: hypothetical protein KIT16_14880 [Rhodospirillaceae bacterium]|nr:hypothetical protein [Rhodospirillaceae bacterium]
MDGNGPNDSPEAILDRLDASIQAALDRLIDGGRISDSHREKAEEFRARLAALQYRLRHHGEASRIALPPETKSDFDLLAWDFKRWVAEVDEDFETKKARPISG